MTVSFHVPHHVLFIAKSFITQLARKTQLYITGLFHNMSFEIMFPLGVVATMTTIVWTCRNTNKISVIFRYIMNITHMSGVVVFF